MSVRGIRATSTRNDYRWRLQSDAYNLDRIEENRGPNSILFGIGSAGGVINSMTKQANLGRNFRKGSVMVGSYDSYRGTVDLNQRLLKDKLALRLNAVHSHMGDSRHHAYNETSRVHLASTFKPRSRTRLRLDFEAGDIDQVTIRAFTGQDGLSNWLRAGSPTYDTVQTADLANRGVSRYATNATRYTAGDLSYSKSRGEADLLMGYRLPKMRFLPQGARLQLNVRNLFDATEPHITRWNATNPTIPSRAALVAPRSWRLTTSFDF